MYLNWKREKSHWLIYIIWNVYTHIGNRNVRNSRISPLSQLCSRVWIRIIGLVRNDIQGSVIIEIPKSPTHDPYIMLSVLRQSNDWKRHSTQIKRIATTSIWIFERHTKASFLTESTPCLLRKIATHACNVRIQFSKCVVDPERIPGFLSRIPWDLFKQKTWSSALSVVVFANAQSRVHSVIWCYVAQCAIQSIGQQNFREDVPGLYMSVLQVFFT